MQLRISMIVPAPAEKVYEYVTSYGQDGPVDDEQFRRRYSEDVRPDDGGYVYTEDIRLYPDDPEDLITWRCVFDYPNRRVMAALDSDWSDRQDDFEPLGDDARWTVAWSMHGSLVQRLTRFLYFKLRRSKVIRREILDPVVSHFKAR